MTITTRIALVAAATAAVGATSSIPAAASTLREDGTATYAASPYAVHMSTLGGHTEAQYLADHHAAGPDARVTV